MLIYGNISFTKSRSCYLAETEHGNWQGTMSPKNNSRHLHRMNRVVNYVRDHLSQDLDLETLADVACLSKYHFTRVFAAHLRESPNQLVSRLRVEMAARKLIQFGNGNITNIAMDCGFSGSDSFSRSFRNRFDCSPRAFRGFSRAGISLDEIDNQQKKEIYKPGWKITAQNPLDLHVNIQNRPNYYVAYIRNIGPYGDVNSSISHTFITLQEWAKERGLLGFDSSFLGRCADNCSITSAQRCMYDACFVLGDEIAEDDIVSVQTIPGGIFAVVQVTCQSAQLNRIWDWLTGIWLPTSGYKISQNTSYEFFPDTGNRPINSRFGIELCLPIKFGI